MKKLIALLSLCAACLFAQSPVVRSGFPAIIQSGHSVSGSAGTTLTFAFGSSTAKNNSLVCAAGSGSSGSLSMTDTQSNTFTRAVTVSQSTTQQAAVFYAVNTAGGADTVTLTGTSSAMGLECYEVSGLLNQTPNVVDVTSTGTNAGSTGPATSSVTPYASNDFALAVVGAAGGTITAGTGWTLDSTSLAPTGGNLVSFGAESQMLSTQGAVTGAFTLGTSNAWAISVALFKITALPVSGTVQGIGTPGASAGGVVSVQGVASGTKVLVTPDSVALPLHQSTNVDQIAGTTPDTNSGTKSAGTQRVVIATDQPQLTNKFLVTPDSVALPANQSVNVNQVAGTTTDTNSGTKSAGTLRVVLATDQPALTNKLLVTPDSVALPSNQSVNMNQIGGTTVVADACQANARTAVVLSLTSNSKIITGTSAKQTYICYIQFALNGTADNVALVEGTGSTCATGTAGMAGGATAATGWNLLSSGSLTSGAFQFWSFKTATTADDVCLFVSSAAQISGVVHYVQQ